MVNQLVDRVEAAESENAALREQLEQAENEVTAAWSRAAVGCLLGLGAEAGARGGASTGAKEPEKGAVCSMYSAFMIFYAALYAATALEL